MWGVELAVMIAMIGFNSVFAGYEIALASVTLARLRRLAEENRRGARVALYMKQHIEASLAVVQLGITLVGAVAAAVGGAGAEENLAPVMIERLGVSDGMAEFLAITLVVVPLIVVTILAGELIPKVFALRNAEKVCLGLSPIMRGFSFSVWPAVWLLETTVRGVMSLGGLRKGRGDSFRPETAELQELRGTAAIARASRLISHREEGIILGAMEMQIHPVRDIMLPVEQISMLDVNASLSDNLYAAQSDMHTRFPVLERSGDRQTVIGYVNVKEMIALMQTNPTQPSIRDIVRPIPSFGAGQAVTECLERLLREQLHLALIRDEDDRVVGMISLEDILEELVGEIEDEFDRLPSHIVPAGASWVAGGGVPLEQLHGTTGMDLAGISPEGGASTLSEWVLGHLGCEVRGGDVVERGPVRVVVRKVHRKKVKEAQICRSGSI